MGKTQGKGVIGLQQACSTIINETSKRLAQVMKHTWGNVAYIETQQIPSLRWVGRLLRGRSRFKLFTICAVGARREGVALTQGTSQGGRNLRRGRNIDTKEGARKERRAKKAWTMKGKEGWRIAKEAGMVLRPTPHKTLAIVHRIKTIKNKNKARPHHPLFPLAE